MKDKLNFPIVDLRELLIPWEKCFSMKLGPIDDESIEVMKSSRYDFAPVLYRQSPEVVLGLISRERLEKLHSHNLPLAADDEGITRPEVQNRIRMDALLEVVQEKQANIVVDEMAEGKKALGLFTVADLNRHPFRAEIYFSLAHLESELAKLIRRSYDDPWKWLELLSDDQQARIIGYWEVSKKRGVDNGPVAAAMLTELLKVAVKAEPLRQTLGYDSATALKKAIGRIPNLRNQIMHPVRPLILNKGQY